MSKTSIIILIICTAVLAAVVMSTLRPNPGIGEVYFVESDSSDNISIENKQISDFDISDSIYLIVPVKDVKTGDSINTNWIEYGNKEQHIIQSDTIAVQDDGSGEIIIYFLKRDGAYYPGQYKAIVEYNNLEKEEASFTVSTPQDPP